MATPLRLYVCDDMGENCCPVKFLVTLRGGAAYVNSDDVNELVSAIHAADDDLQNGEDDDGD